MLVHDLAMQLDSLTAILSEMLWVHQKVMMSDVTMVPLGADGGENVRPAEGDVAGKSVEETFGPPPGDSVGETVGLVVGPTLGVAIGDRVKDADGDTVASSSVGGAVLEILIVMQFGRLMDLL